MPVIGPISSESVSVSETAVGLTAATAKGVVPAAAEIRVQGAPIRYRCDGTTITAVTGRRVEIGETFELKNRGEVTSFSAISDGPDQAELEVALAVDWKP